MTVLPAAHVALGCRLPVRLDTREPHHSNVPATTAHNGIVARSVPNREETMADPIYKVVEVVGTSEQSISKAIDNAINKASGTLRNLAGSKLSRCGVRSRTERFNAIRSL